MIDRQRAVFTQHNNVIGNINVMFAIKELVPGEVGWVGGGLWAYVGCVVDVSVGVWGARSGQEC
jgi:hypothetical protein